MHSELTESLNPFITVKKRSFKVRVPKTIGEDYEYKSKSLFLGVVPKSKRLGPHSRLNTVKIRDLNEIGLEGLCLGSFWAKGLVNVRLKNGGTIKTARFKVALDAQLDRIVKAESHPYQKIAKRYREIKTDYSQTVSAYIKAKRERNICLQTLGYCLIENSLLVTLVAPEHFIKEILPKIGEYSLSYMNFFHGETYRNEP